MRPDRNRGLALTIGVAMSLSLGAQAGGGPADEQDDDHGTHDEAHGPGEGLMGWMGLLQTLSHKLHLSVLAGNSELADFYLHELEEAVEGLEQDVESYDGFPVGRMAPAMLGRAMEQLDESVDAGDWARARERSASLFQACNACHQATDHGYIVVAPTEVNPFAQRFGSPED